MLYKHTQFGTVTIVALAAGALLALGIALAIASRPGVELFDWPVLIAAGTGVVVAIAGWLFSVLTISVDRERLRWTFGPGVFCMSIRLSDIQTTEQVRNPWCYGWGIHKTPRGWLYNVSGFEAVEIRLKSGKAFRLGTDEPGALMQAIGRATGGAG
jgi:hypothetical protein